MTPTSDNGSNSCDCRRGNAQVARIVKANPALLGCVVANINYPEQSQKEMHAYLADDSFAALLLTPLVETQSVGIGGLVVVAIKPMWPSFDGWTLGGLLAGGLSYTVGKITDRNQIIEANLRLVFSIAKRYASVGSAAFDEFIGEGHVTLMRAVEKFDPSKGAKLSSYAAWWIKQSMRRALANQARTIRIPVQSATKISKIQAARTKLTEDLGREPSDKEIAVEVNLTERTVTGLRLGRTTTISLHDPIQHGEDGERERAAHPEGVLQGELFVTHARQDVEGGGLHM